MRPNFNNMELIPAIVQDYQTKEVLESCGIPANKRAEELNIDDYIRILERSHTL